MKNFKKINDSMSIMELMKNLARQKETTISIRVKEKQFQGTMKFNHKVGNEPLVYHFEENCVFQIGDNVEISFYYKDTFFSFESQIIDILEKLFVINVPEAVNAAFTRRSTRYKIKKDENAFLTFQDKSETFKIVEISTTGLSFELNSAVFSEGETLRNVLLNLSESVSFYFDAVVKYVRQGKNSFTCGLSFNYIDWSSSQALFHYIFQKYYPDLKSLTDFSENDMNELLNEIRKMGTGAIGNGKNEFIDEITNINKVKDKPTITINLVHKKNNIITGANSALRIYNRTFWGHQSVLQPEVYLNPKVNADIFIGLAEYLMNHTYFENFVTYINADFEWQLSVFKNISFIVNDSEKLSFEEQLCFEYDFHNEIEEAASEFNTEIMDDPSEFIGYCNDSITTLERQCFAYSKENYELDEIKGIYYTLGYTLARRIFKTSINSKAAAYSVAECFSKEINFNNTLNTLKIYLLEEDLDLDTIIQSILVQTKMFFRINNVDKIRIYIQFPSNKTENGLINILDKRVSINRVLMNREGMVEFIRLLMSSFEYHTKFYNLSEPQKSIWHTEKFFSGTSIGNVSATLKIKGDIDYELLEKAINIFVEKNDGMRLRIIEDNGIAKQYVCNYNYFKIDFLDFSNKDISEFYKWNEEQTKKPFKLTDSALYYFALVKLGENIGGFYANTHHLISDAWTMNLVASQVIENYQCLKNNQKISSVKKPSYIDFLIDQDQFRYSDRFLKCKEFWSEKYDENFQAAYLKPSSIGSFSTKAKRRTVILDNALTSSIIQYCDDHKVSVFSLFMAIFSIYISRKTNVNDVVIGTPIFNRSGVKEKETTGMFVSTIPVKILVQDNMDFKSYTQYVAKELGACLKNQKYNYELILKDYREKYKVVDKLYDCLISYQNSKYEKGSQEDNIESRWHFNQNQVESLILHLDDREGSGKLIMNIDYLIDAFNEEEIDEVYKSLENLIKDATTNYQNNISNLEMIDKQDKNLLLNTVEKFNDTKAEYPKEMTIHQMFEEQVIKTPNAIALLCEGRALTYAELNEKSNQLSRHLRNRGVKPNSLVGIMVYRSFEMIIGILGILKAGGAYLPLDPEYPEDRREYILENAEVAVLLTHKGMGSKLSDSFYKIDLEDEEIYTGDSSNLQGVNKPNDLAYVIFTSGSTGKPKGVMIEHYSVINRLNWMQKRYPLNSDDVILQKTPYTFDVSVWELFWWSFYGGKLAILCPGGEKDPSKIIETINNYKVSIIHFVPSMLSIFLDFLQREDNNDKINSLKQVFSSGEALTLKHVERFFEGTEENNVNLTNLYGPTEATVDVSYFDCKKGDNLKTVPIGKPIDNIRLYILNKDLQIQPIGESGELCIAGDGLARGYLNAADITSEKFIRSEFLSEERIYKTGDLSRWLPNGDIEYLGRIDNQVKIRGLRIELGEIEYQLLKFQSIKEAVVIDRKDESNNSYLSAYYVAEGDVSISDLREHLSKNLPTYMIPSYFTRMEKLPLSPNGKIDRKRLPNEYLSISIDEEIIEPRNDIEKRIADIWKKELNIEKVGVKTNFFNIGGDSLKAINVSMNIGEGITISDIYNYPTIEELAKKVQFEEIEDSIFYTIKENKKDSGVSVVCVPYGGGAPIVYNGLGNELSKLSERYSIYSVVLPGHNFGGKEEPFMPIEEVATQCVEEIKNRVKNDIILYGHCVGSALTFEIARLLEEEKIKVKAVYIGGIIPPKTVKYCGNILDPWKWQKDETIIKYLNKLGGANYAFGNDEMSLILKAFRHDVKCYMKYFYSFYENKYTKISIPVYLLIGEEDSSTKNFEKKYKEWLNYCEKINLITLKDANHYFIKSHAQDLARIIDNNLKLEGE